MYRCRLAVFAGLIFLFWTVTGAYAGSNNNSQPSGISENQEYEDFGLDDEFEETPGAHVIDPLSGYNRFMTQVNDKIYFWILKPVAKGLSKVVPEPGREAISRFFKNIFFPIRMVNNLLQLKIKRAGIETARFGVNTTIGILGFGDPAKNWLNLDAYDEDFGQTLGHYGIGSGFHLVWPILGPSNVRDTIGMVPDYFLNPISYVDNLAYEAAIKSADGVNNTSLHIGEYEDMKEEALDLYIFLRDAYEQNREKKIAE